MKNEPLIILNHSITSRSKRVINFSYLKYILPLLMILLGGCEEQFVPVQENERHFFSVNGYLDASADTQWVRVMPVRETLIQESGLPVPKVTLQHVGSSESAVMQDSLFHFTDGRYAYNFWTTMPVQPEETYHLTIEGQDERISSAETTLPKDFPAPQFREPEFGADILLVEEVERLADIQVFFRIRFTETGNEFHASFPYLTYSVHISPETYRIPINPEFAKQHIMDMHCDIRVLKREIFIAAGGPDWLDFLSLDKHTIALPDGVSNIENGVGYFGGIISKTFPYINTEGDSGLFSVQCPS